MLSASNNSADFARWKYLLNLPGERSGTYSRHLQTILPLKSVILRWQTPWYEFYYMPLQSSFHHITTTGENITPSRGRTGLRPHNGGFVEYQHYIPVNRSTLSAAVAALRANDSGARQLAENSRRFFESHLSSELIGGYWQSLLVRYQRLQRFDPVDILLQQPFCSCAVK